MNNGFIEDMQVRISVDPDTFALLWDHLAYEKLHVKESSGTKSGEMGAIKDLIVTLGSSAARIRQAAIALVSTLKSCLRQPPRMTIDYEVTNDEGPKKTSINLEGIDGMDKLLPTIEELLKNLKS